MQTFLPYPSFEESARCLDNKRLGKQRVESLTILKTLRGEISGWKYHPAVKMWRGYEEALKEYGRIICIRWVVRGFNDSLFSNFEWTKGIIYPPWLGDERLHSSHRSNLLRKDFKWYSQFGWKEDATLVYWWPEGCYMKFVNEMTDSKRRK